VQATAVFGFSEAYHRYVRPLSAFDKDLAFVESQAAACLYGATGLPRSWAAWEALLASDRAATGRLKHPRPTSWTIIGTAPLVPAPMRPLQRLLVRAAVEISPEPVRSLPQLRGRGLRSAKRRGACAGALRRCCRWAIRRRCRPPGASQRERSDRARPQRAPRFTLIGLFARAAACAT
jgi:uncharacterized protein (DUF2236 family)